MNVTVVRDLTLQTAEYRVPTKFESKEVRVQKISFKLPFPFLSESQAQNDVPIIKLQGSLKDFYNSPVPNRNITIEVTSVNYTRTYNITSDGSGNFVLEIALAKGVEYTVTYKFAGDRDSVYVESQSSKSIFVEELSVETVFEAPKTLMFVIVIIAAAGAVAALIFIAKKKKAVARARIESEFRFFRRL